MCRLSLRHWVLLLGLLAGATVTSACGKKEEPTAPPLPTECTPSTDNPCPN